jgi:hypothetical protein
VLGCVYGAFVGNYVGALLKNKNLSEIDNDVINDAINLINNAEGLERG